MKSFDEFLGENDETNKLSRKFGLSEPQTLDELQNNFYKMQSAFIENPKVKESFKIIKEEFNKLYPQYIDEDSPDWDEFNEEIYRGIEETKPDELSLFDFVWFQ